MIWIWIWLIWLLYILKCHPEHVHIIYLHKNIYYMGIRYTLAKRISLLNCCFRTDVGIFIRCERLNIWTEHLYNLSWRCIPTSHETWAIAAVSFKSLISEISTSYTNGRDPCRRPYLPPETKVICRRNLGWVIIRHQPKQCNHYKGNKSPIHLHTFVLFLISQKWGLLLGRLKLRQKGTYA